jgi:hypothetical protein
MQRAVAAAMAEDEKRSIELARTSASTTAPPPPPAEIDEKKKSSDSLDADDGNTPFNHPNIARCSLISDSVVVISGYE